MRPRAVAAAIPDVASRTLSDEALRTTLVDDLNGKLQHYHPAARASRADALRFVEQWNSTKLSTRATCITADGLPFVVVVDA